MAEVRVGSARIDFIGRNAQFIAATRRNARALRTQGIAIRNLNSRARQFNATAQGTVALLFRMRAAFFALTGFGGIAALVRQTSQAADRFLILQARVRLAVKDLGLLSRVTDDVFAGAAAPSGFFENVLSVYQQVIGSTRTLRAETDLLREAARAAATALAFDSGATQDISTEALRSTQEFLGGLAGGRLTGELADRLVAESRTFADTLAAGLGVGVDQLSDLARAGELSIERVTTALRAQAGELRDAFEQAFAENTATGIERTTALLQKLSQEIRAPLESTTFFYQRLAQSTRTLEIDQERLLAITRAVSQALLISGSSAKEASQSNIQFIQGLASNRLSGDELRSVLEQNLRLAQALADGVGVTIGELRALGKSGALTTEVVVNALLTQVGRINTEFRDIPRTTEGALIQLQNSLLTTVGPALLGAEAVEAMSGAFDRLRRGVERSGFADQLATSFTSLVNVITRSVDFLGQMGHALLFLITASVLRRLFAGAVAIRQIGIQAGAATRSVQVLHGAFIVLGIAARAILRALGVGLVIEGVLLLIRYFGNLRDTVRETGSTIGDALVIGILDGVEAIARAVIDVPALFIAAGAAAMAGIAEIVRGAAGEVEVSFRLAFLEPMTRTSVEVLNRWAATRDRMAQLGYSLIEVINTRSEASLRALSESGNALFDSTSTRVNAAAATMLATISAVGSGLQEIFARGIGGVGDAVAAEFNRSRDLILADLTAVDNGLKNIIDDDAVVARVAAGNAAILEGLRETDRALFGIGQRFTAENLFGAGATGAADALEGAQRDARTTLERVGDAVVEQFNATRQQIHTLFQTEGFTETLADLLGISEDRVAAARDALAEAGTRTLEQLRNLFTFPEPSEPPVPPELPDVPNFTPTQDSADRARGSVLRLSGAAAQVGQAFRRFGQDVLVQFDSIEDAARSLAQAILSAFLDALVFQPIANAISGFVAGAFGVPFLGAGAGTGAIPPAARGGVFADGGYAGRGLALVGERGPELVDFQNPARVYTAEQLAAGLGGGGGGTVINFSPVIQTADESGVRRALADILPQFSEVVRGGIAADLGRPSAMRQAARRR